MTTVLPPPVEQADIPTEYLRTLRADEETITAADVAGRTARVPAIRPSGRAVPVVLTGRWRDRANCLGVNPDLFYPERFDSVTLGAALEACAGCVVRARCLAEALELREDHGVWGGTTREERRRMLRGLPRWARCRGCGDRYLRTAPGQQYCAPSCRAISAKYRRETEANPRRRVSSRRRIAS
jgi:WhiB family redox-sensing transcriptional regulator